MHKVFLHWPQEAQSDQKVHPALISDSALLSIVIEIFLKKKEKRKYKSMVWIQTCRNTVKNNREEELRRA